MVEIVVVLVSVTARALVIMIRGSGGMEGGGVYIFLNSAGMGVRGLGCRTPGEGRLGRGADDIEMLVLKMRLVRAGSTRKRDAMTKG